VAFVKGLGGACAQLCWCFVKVILHVILLGGIVLLKYCRELHQCGLRSHCRLDDVIFVDLLSVVGFYRTSAGWLLHVVHYITAGCMHGHPSCTCPWRDVHVDV
jgi:hypothetical protein